jgi:inner membrane transporter RhtA
MSEAARGGKKPALLVPISALLGAMLSIQYGATRAEALFPAVGAQGTTALRLAVAAVMLGVVMRPWRVRPSPRAWPALLGYGAALGAMNLCFYMALRTIPLGVAVAIEFLGPLAVAIFSSRRRIDLVWIALAIGGIAMLSPVVHGVRGLDWVGVAFALGAGLFWGFYIIFGQRAGAELGAQTVAFGTVIAAAFVLPVGIIHAGSTLLSPGVLLSALAVGLFSSALPYSLEMVALTRLPATVYGTLTSLEPALGALMGLLILDQRLGAMQWAGIGVVVAAALGAALTMRSAIAVPE